LRADNGQAGSHRLIRWSSGNPLVLTEFASFKSGDVKGTIRRDMRLPFVSNDVRRHRLISISYISLLPVTAEAAGSSPVVPAIILKRLWVDVVLRTGADRCKPCHSPGWYLGLNPDNSVCSSGCSEGALLGDSQKPKNRVLRFTLCGSDRLCVRVERQPRR